MKKRYRVVVAAAIAVVVIAEAAARIVLGLGDPPLSMPHATVEYMYLPNQVVMRFGNRFLINEHGMRSESFQERNDGDEIRIMVFGDSVVNGGNLTDHEDLATTLLAQRLENAHVRHIRVGNISAGSWGPGNWLAYAKEFGFFDADVVVLVVSSHDAADNPTFAALDPDTHPQTKPVLALIEGVTRYLPRHLKRLGANSQSESAPRRVDTPAAMQNGLSDLRAFLALASAKASHVLVLQHAERSEIENARFVPGHAAIKRVVEEFGVPVIQLGPVFAAAIQRGEQPYRDNIHPNETGQGLIASVLLEQLTLNRSVRNKPATHP